MKLPRFEPEIALIFGFVLVPLAGALNWLIVTFFSYGPSPSLRFGFFQMMLSLVIICGPQGWMTTRLLQIWRKGDLGKARSLSLGCALFALVFWTWFFRMSRQVPASIWDAPEIAAFALPVLWSLGFALFPFLSRAPRH